MNTTEELLEDSDTSDDDYVPEDKCEVLSEIDSDGDPEDDLLAEDGNKKNKKRAKNVKNPRKKQKKVDDNCDTSVQKSEELSEEDRKKKEEDIWADFMKDTGFQLRKNINNSNVPINKTPAKSSNEKVNLINKPEEKVKITRIFEFAGEEVTVEKEVPVGSAESRLLNISASQSTKTKNKGGLSGISGILNQIGKKPKISTLEKSKLDWDKFKKEENLEEELQNYNKGKDGYLERQDFLQRADLRTFEIEKEIRTVERNRRMNNSL